MFSISYFYFNYVSFPILFLFIFINIAISCLFLSLSYFLSRKNPYKEKNSPYECGYNPFRDARMRSDIRFYLVAILFIIFDLEIIFIFPWALTFIHLIHISLFSYSIVLFFLFLLTVGFIYEWKKGALDW
jgi:NADH-quinone oxidoreductase subunit A